MRLLLKRWKRLSLDGFIELIRKSKKKARKSGLVLENVFEDDVHVTVELFNQFWEIGRVKVYKSITARGRLITMAGVFDSENM